MLELEYPESPLPCQHVDITPDDVDAAISELKNSASPGCSGIGNLLLKENAKLEGFKIILSKCFNELINGQVTVDQITPLFESYLIGIPKNNSD